MCKMCTNDGNPVNLLMYTDTRIIFLFVFQHEFETRVFLIHWEQHVCSPETPAAMRHPGNRENEALKCGNNLTQNRILL